METLHILLIIWIIMTVFALALVILNILNTQAVIDKLKTQDPTKWQDFETISQLAIQHILWLILLLILTAEVISISFPEVRTWIFGRKLIGALIYVLPILVVIAIMLVARFRKK